MHEAVPKEVLQQVRLCGVHGASGSGAHSGAAVSGSSASGILQLPPSRVGMQTLVQGAWSSIMAMTLRTLRVGMQASVQGAWSAIMAMREGKKPSRSPEEIARQITHRSDLPADQRLGIAKGCICGKCEDAWLVLGWDCPWSQARLDQESRFICHDARWGAGIDTWTQRSALFGTFGVNFEVVAYVD